MFMKFDPHLKQEISDAADEDGITMTTLVHEAVTEYLQRRREPVWVPRAS